MEQVDALAPPMFKPSGERLTATEAIWGGRWLGTVNIWVYRFNKGQIEFLYHERDPDSIWMPGRLDIAGGFYKAGEPKTKKSRLGGALRELEEEIGLKPKPNRLTYITRRLNVSISQKGNQRKTCCDVYALEFKPSDEVLLKHDIETGVLEATATYWISLKDLLAMHKNHKVNIEVTRTAPDGSTTKRTVSANDFCPNYDDYQFTMPATVSAVVKSQ